MLTIPLPIQAPPQAWVGKAKAFAVYLSESCMPQERLGTAYAVRKVFEDGSTVTVVKVVPNPQRAMPIEMYWFGGGRMERDAKGRATKIDSRLDGLGGTDPQGRPYTPTVIYDARLKVSEEAPDGPLEGDVAAFHGAGARLRLHDRTRYLLDPLEAIAFGPSALQGGAWLFPNSPLAHPKFDRSAPGSRWTLKRDFQVALAFDGDETPRVYNPVRLVRQWVGAPTSSPEKNAGTLLYRLDGSLAAYVPASHLELLPSLTGWRGAMTSKDWAPSAKVRVRDHRFPPSSGGIFVPEPLSPDAERAILNRV